LKTKRLWILTMFPEYFSPLIEYGVLGSALRNERGDGSGVFQINTVLISNYCAKGYKGVDDSPFGGGIGMIMRPDVLKDALIEGVVVPGQYDVTKIKDQLLIICPAPRGVVWNHKAAMQFAKKNLSFDNEKDLVFICGRYEGIDERFLENYVDEFYSVGDYILTGGELAVMMMLDSSMRFHPGVLGNKESAIEESFANNLLEHALYTRPREFEGKLVPEALISGDHKKMQAFKVQSSMMITKKNRPDLLKKDN
jgi:tRNA (guanine37-N1)-methyltransferase